MKAVRFLGNGVCDVAEVPMPIRKKGEVLLKVMSSAVCGSENPSYFAERTEGYMIPGHEMSGQVVEADEASGFVPGDTVVAQIMIGCGECLYCKQETYTFCENLEYGGSTHAQYCSMDEKCVIKAPSDIPYDTLVLLGGDTVGVANRAAKQLDLAPGKLVYVSGAGPIGLGVIALLKHYGCYVVVSEPSKYRRDYAVEHANADKVLDPTTMDIKKVLREMTEGVGPEIIIECSGNPKAQLEALEFARCGGTVMLCGENYTELKIIPSMHIIHKELSVKGAFYFTAADFTDMVGMYREGLDVSTLVSHRVPIEQAPEVIAEFAKGRTGKVILHPQD